VTLVNGRQVTPAIVHDIDILLVRSVTKVNRGLLEGSRVRFVGTATIGTDHIDLEYLRANGIAFADAAGSNANSVAEYVTAALMFIEKQRDISFEGKTLGVVGVGNVGTKVCAKAKTLGMQVLRNDPPRAELEAQSNDQWATLSEVLEQADVITVHTPLTFDGKYPTHHLFGTNEFKKLRQGAVFINTARGGVVDSQALLASRLSQLVPSLSQNQSITVLDVWEHEPNIDIEILKRVTLGTPHIAGYSYDGKIAGTRMLAEAVATFLGQPLIWDNALTTPVPVSLGYERCHSTTTPIPERSILQDLILQAYLIEQDHARMLEMIQLPPDERGQYFDRLRKEYPTRLEFSNFQISEKWLDNSLKEQLIALGFQLKLEES
jgi:erythronate-4-phosphate dehydrogenase